MELPAPQLAALVAVVDHGTFEAAARELHVTASAVSQRIRALESAVGQVLVRRASPCTATPAGATLVRLGRAQALLQAEARTALEPDEGRRTELGLAVNADSLATWFRDVLAEAATWDDTVLRLEVEDQAHSHELLRRGETLAAVTSDPEPVQGCSVEPLGTMRYLAAAAPALLERSGSREPDWSRMPVVVFNAKDTLQHDLLAEVGVATGHEPPTHRVPTSTDFLEAVVLGLGWGMVPETQLLPLERAGRLVRLRPDRPVDVPLHWQRWRLDSLLLGRVTEAVRRAASAHLRR
ncbi:LysR family transcriptional regulator ArgP [uncultured Nocardioides sp.]|uniref:LysR family transcriptional regulator ArgP n=1 Tax=uncultured Nocardioides sp. TaxID=198441 RepID=UPI0026191735|nr:LysR family transcriptional regulator ArgP [uncultured Nocardioides sp.]